MRRALLLSLFFLPLFAFGYYNPGTPSGFVNDFARMLSANDRQMIDAKLSEFEKSSSNEITVVTIPSLKDETIEDFAVKLFEEWKIGKAKDDNGILLLIARDEREMRIEVGYGLEGALPDAIAKSIIEDLATPAFREGRYGEGIQKSVDAMIAATRGEYQGAAEKRSIPLDAYEQIAAACLFGFVWLSSILARSKSWWAGGFVGGAIGTGIGVMFGFLYLGIAALAFLIPLGLFLDYVVSRGYERGKVLGHIPWYAGGGRGHWGGGGFGGFGGGMSGGGGASGKW